MIDINFILASNIVFTVSFLLSISLDFICFGLLQKELNKSIGKAAKPIPPNSANSIHETNNKTAIAYIKKLTFI